MQKHNGRPQAIADELEVGIRTYQAWRRELGIHMVMPLTPKQRFVLDKRFGLDGDHPQTLEAIALTLHATPGAVRSIQRAALARVVRDPSLICPKELAIIRSVRTRIPPARLP